jgi:transposase
LINKFVYLRGVGELTSMQAAAPNYKQMYEQSQLRITALEQQLQKMIFGFRQERFIPATPNDPQLVLDIPAETVATVSVTGAQKISYIRQGITAEPKPLQHPGRTKLPESLRREQIIIEPDADTSACKKMGEEITEVLEYQPGELYVKQYRRIKYARPDNGDILIGELPSRPLPKVMAGEGLLAQIIIDKYIDHLPLHRQMQRFERVGVKLPYSTLTDWVGDTCQLITPLFNALKAEVLHSGYLHADETPIKVIDKDKKGETHRGFYWVYQNSIDKLVFFDYQEGRGREGPMEILENFKGYLQTDGYAAYNIFNKHHGIILMHCMAHARRMFNEALENDHEKASYALNEIQKLYEIERISRAAGLKQQYVHVLPKSAIGKALAYSMERWSKLSLYITDGRLNIDNNPVENSIRPVALGRKNYLFAGSHEAAKRSGMLYSLLGTCKMHSIEPYGWLKQVLQRIADHPINKIQELLPHRCKV